MKIYLAGGGRHEIRSGENVERTMLRLGSRNRLLSFYYLEDVKKCLNFLRREEIHETARTVTSKVQTK